MYDVTIEHDGTDIIDWNAAVPMPKDETTVNIWQQSHHDFFCIVLYYSEYLLWQIKKVIHCISHLSILYQDTFTHHFQTRLLSLL